MSALRPSMPRAGWSLALAACVLLAASCATPRAPDAPAPPPPPAQTWFTIVPDRPGAMPVVVAEVNGTSLRTVLDTGATTSAVSAEAALELALTPVGTELVRDASGAQHELPTFALDVALGPHRTTVHATPMRRTAGIDVILGRDFLDDVELYVPRGGDQLALFAPGAGPRTGLTRVPVERDADGMFVSLDARTPAGRAVRVRMLLDTGASLSRITLADAGSDEVDPRGARAGRALHGGLVTFGDVLLGDARLGAARVGTLRVNVDDAPGAPALLGTDALSRFDVLIATGRNELWLGEAWDARGATR